MRLDLRRLAVMLAGCAAFIDLYSPQGLLPLLADSWQLGPREASLTVTATTLAVALVAPFAGSLADMIGRKRVIATAALLLAIPTFFAANASGFHELLAWRFAQGLLIPPIFAVIIAYIAEEWDRHEARAVTTLYLSGAIAGGFLGRFITGLVAEHAGWRGAFVALGFVNLALGLAVVFGLPRERRFVASGSITRSARAMLDHLANPQLLAACAVGFAVLFALVAAFTYVNFLLAGAPYSLGPAALGTVFAVYLLGMVTTPVSARLLQRLGPRRFQVLAVAIALVGIALTLVPALAAIVAGLMVMSAGVFLSQAATTTYVGESVTSARSAAVGLYVMTYYIGGSLGAVLPGTAWHLAGWPGVAAVVALVEIAAGAIALVLWRDAAPPRGAPERAQPAPLSR
jgi:predicted MFS family arabinose efflux permease